MAIAEDLLTLFILLWFCLSFVCCGNRLLRVCCVQLKTNVAHLLISVALGLIVTETMLLLVQFSQQIRLGCYFVIVILLLFVLTDGRNIVERIAQLAKWDSLSKIECFL